MCSEPTGGILDFCSVYRFFAGELELYFFAVTLPEWLAYGLAAFALALIVINAIVMITGLYTWFERRGAAPGPGPRPPWPMERSTPWTLARSWPTIPMTRYGPLFDRCSGPSLKWKAG